MKPRPKISAAQTSRVPRNNNEISKVDFGKIDNLIMRNRARHSSSSRVLSKQSNLYACNLLDSFTSNDLKKFQKKIVAQSNMKMRQRS